MYVVVILWLFVFVPAWLPWAGQAVGWPLKAQKYIYIYGSVPLIWDQGRFTYAVTTVCGAGAGVGPELVHFVFLLIFK